MRHPNEIDLLPEHTDDEVRQHLEICAECSARAEELRHEWSDEVARVKNRIEQKPESFWEGQRAAIRERIVREERSSMIAPRSWIVVAALLMIALSSGLLLLRELPAPSDAIDPISAENAAPMEIEMRENDPYDPWESEDLQAFHQVVQWESWIEEETPGENGGTS